MRPKLALAFKEEPPKEKPPRPTFDPAIVLDVLPKLMNSQVVSCAEDLTLRLTSSYKALYGIEVTNKKYCFGS